MQSCSVIVSAVAGSTQLYSLCSIVQRCDIVAAVALSCTQCVLLCIQNSDLCCCSLLIPCAIIYCTQCAARALISAGVLLLLLLCCNYKLYSMCSQCPDLCWCAAVAAALLLLL
jgi:hypothetical protein